MSGSEMGGAAEAPAKRKLSKEQIDAIERRQQMRQKMLTAFLRWYRSGNYTPLTDFFSGVRQDFDKRQSIEDNKAEKEGRKARVVSRKLSSCAYIPQTNRPMYINVKPDEFCPSGIPRLGCGQGFHLATPTITPKLNDNFTFQVSHAVGVCDLSAIHAWLLKTSDERRDSRTLNSFRYNCTLEELFAEIKLPEETTLIFVPGLYYTDIYATKNLDPVRERFPELAVVIAHKMNAHGIMSEDGDSE